MKIDRHMTVAETRRQVIEFTASDLVAAMVDAALAWPDGNGKHGIIEAGDTVLTVGSDPGTAEMFDVLLGARNIIGRPAITMVDADEIVARLVLVHRTTSPF